MDYLIPAIMFLFGVVLIVKGGDFFVDAAVWIAEATGIAWPPRCQKLSYQ